VNGLFEQLAAITASSSDSVHGIEATVNLDGKLVGLTLAPQALSLAPATLAEAIFTVTQRAAALALREGLELVGPVAGEDLRAELTELVETHPGADPRPVAPAPRPPEEDFSIIQTWALPR
jgi:hypothetical protein